MLGSHADHRIPTPRPGPSATGAPADISLRPLTERDLSAVADMWQRCDPASRSARFHGGMPVLPADHLPALLADPGSGVVAVHRPTCAVIALACLMRNRDGESGDLGVLVEDSWHRHGLARRLTTVLVLTAPARGIRVITAEIFTEHSHLGRLLRRIPGEFSSVGKGPTTSVAVRLAVGASRTARKSH